MQRRLRLHVTCDEHEPCRDINCENGARCVLECTVSDCSFHTCSGGSGAARCDDGSLVCNRACPDGSEGEPIEEDDDDEVACVEHVDLIGAAQPCIVPLHPSPMECDADRI